MINVTKLDRELKRAGISIHGVDGFPDGKININFKSDATPSQRSQAQIILVAHDPRDYDEEKQRAALNDFRTLPALAGRDDLQIQSWVDINVTDFAEMKNAIKILARAIGALARDRGVV
jgi:hypothetical protein